METLSEDSPLEAPHCETLLSLLSHDTFFYFTHLHTHPPLRRLGVLIKLMRSLWELRHQLPLFASNCCFIHGQICVPSISPAICCHCLCQLSLISLRMLEAYDAIVAICCHLFCQLSYSSLNMIVKTGGFHRSLECLISVFHFCCTRVAGHTKS